MKIIFKIKMLIGLGVLLFAQSSSAACNATATSKQLTISITAPVVSPMEFFTMSGVGAALTTLAAANSGGNNAELQWTFPECTFPSGNTGTSVAANTPSTWPADNSSFFGESEITLEYDPDFSTEGTAGDCSKTVAVKVFFDPTAMITVDEPAWFRYFGDGVIDGLSDMSFNKNMVSTRAGETVWFTGSMSIGPLAYSSSSTLLFTARVVAHEHKHSELINELNAVSNPIYNAFWEEWGVSDGSAEWIAAEAACSAATQALDSDGDLILDSKEAGYGTTLVYSSPGCQYSGPDDRGDNGYLARQAELNAASLIDRTNDWSDRNDNPNRVR